ncbi:MAG TPA: hypothetical protein VJ978_10845, partial [Nitriliruptoraceae bacterium]|nr:hypothetical protein [Nitriliruptoraceae bacterium]
IGQEAVSEPDTGRMVAGPAVLPGWFGTRHSTILVGSGNPASWWPEATPAHRHHRWTTIFVLPA